MKLAALGILTALSTVSAPDTRSPMAAGSLTADQETTLLAEVVRYGVRDARPTCANYGWKGGLCLSLRNQTEDPPSELMKLLADIQPPLRPASDCRREGIINSRGSTTDPVIDVEWLRVRADGSVEARVLVYCMVSQPVCRSQGKRWLVKERSGWIGCGPVPGDCQTMR